ncbi:MAG: hypothetical protein ATN36_01430 [Epulopiscium sp. Nele67-Bin005]|nr:MAG: hypothetical protein ATN36_01430 [Epulopiscium sp. Nele67-Bin005]
MFGYVIPLKQELKIREFETFRSYYCGLCCHIKQDFGHMPRVALNYDLTAMAILLDALSPTKTYYKNQGCITNPIKNKRIINSNQALKYTSAINVILAYYKAIDDVNDDNSLKGKVLSYSLQPYLQKIDPKYNKVQYKIKHSLDELSALEANLCTTSNNKTKINIDEIANPFATLVGNILKYYPYKLTHDSQHLRKQLYNFGYSLGKWIYVIDALDDFKKDIAHNKFNPLAEIYLDETKTLDENFRYIKKEVEFTLLSCGATCEEILLSLPLQRNRNILTNIVTLGMMAKYSSIGCTCKKCRRKKCEQKI